MAHYDGDRPSPTPNKSMMTSCIWANSVQISSFALFSSFARLLSLVEQGSFPIHSLGERKGSPLLSRSRHQSLSNFALKYLVLLFVLCNAALSATTNAPIMAGSPLSLNCKPSTRDSTLGHNLFSEIETTQSLPQTHTLPRYLQAPSR